MSAPDVPAEPAAWDPVYAFADFVGGVPRRQVALPWGECGVWDLGEGRPVVLLHGIVASRRVFFRLAPLLAAAGRRVIVPVLRGEEFPVSALRYSEMLDDLHALLSALDLTDATLLGVSFGGSVALAYGGRRDPRVRDILVQGTFARFPLGALDRLTLALSGVAPAWLGTRFFVRRIRRGPGIDDIRRLSPELYALHERWCRATPFSTLRARLRLVRDCDLREDLRRTEAALTFVEGGVDALVPPARFRELCEIRPDARALLWPDCGHSVPLTHPRRLAALVGAADA